MFNPFAALSELTTQVLFQLYQVTGNLGLAIIVMTVLIRFALVPLSIGQLKSAKKMQELKPELDSLKKQHGKDKQKLQQAQMELYKRYNINPLAGCLPMLVQVVLLYVIYQVFINFLKTTTLNGVEITSSFLWLDLTKPDRLYILPALAFVSQMTMSLMISPGAEVPDIVPNNSKSKKVKKENEKEEDFAQMAEMMQKQMLFMMPVMTGIMTLTFPSGMSLYWVVTTIFSVIQQYFISGWGGLTSYTKLALSKVAGFKKQTGQ